MFDVLLLSHAKVSLRKWYYFIGGSVIQDKDLRPRGGTDLERGYGDVQP